MRQLDQKSKAYMTDKTLSERLRALAKDDTKRTTTARLREVFDDIEAALGAGVSQASVQKVLEEGGLKMSLGTFRNSLLRERARRAKVGSKRPPRVEKPTGREPTLDNMKAEQPSVGPNNETDSDQIKRSSHDPKDLDAIIGSTPNLDALAKIGRGTRK